MNKTAIKIFSIEARRKLIASVKDKAGRIGITKDKITEPISQGEGYAIFPTHIGIETKISGKEIKQRENLVNKIRNTENGYEQVMEEVAYTWFNRIIAVRFMEVNDYLPSRVRVLSSETKGKFEPDIVTQAPNIELELSNEEIENIILLKESNSVNELFRVLFIKQCNELGKVLPELFENTSKVNKDYTEILLDLSYTNEDGVIRDLLKIDEADFLEAVEIIGWMYQYYNTEPKALVDAYTGKKKVPKEDVPAKTQLFTPDWIVRYMVENSVGRLWLEGHPNATLKESWEYYLDDVEQEPTVLKQLEAIKENYKNLKLEEIKVLDPCMGSGHILVYAFEVLMEIYLASGYTERDAASLIIKKNLYGLDIDDRAYQLAYFAVMMKGRKYDRRFLTREIQANLCSIKESNLLRSFEDGAEQLQICDMHKETANYLIDTFKNAKEYGSLIDVEVNDYDGLQNYILELEHKGANDIFETIWIQNIAGILSKIIKQAKILSYSYDIVITNPPYFSSSDMSPKLSEYVKTNYPNSKSDMFAVFIEKCLELTKKSGLVAMITMHSWMFLSSYDQLRGRLKHYNLVNMLHLGARAFEEIGGEVVQATSYVYRKEKINGYNSSFVRLLDYKSETSKKEAYLDRVKNSIDCFISKQENFEKIPGMPMAYWVGSNFTSLFSKYPSIDQISKPRRTLQTGDSIRFMRYWYEVDIAKTNLSYSDREDAINSNCKWFMLSYGGKNRKWYGNLELVVNWENNGMEIKSTGKAIIPSESKYFLENIGWSKVTSGDISIRFYPKGIIPGDATACIFDYDHSYYHLAGYMNSKVVNEILKILSPTLNFATGTISQIPINVEFLEDYKTIEKVKDCISISRNDWNSFETSWDFQFHPMIKSLDRVKEAYTSWKELTQTNFKRLKANEEDLNSIFIDVYGLTQEMTPQVDEKDITVYRIFDKKNDDDKKMRYVLDRTDAIQTFISYAVGCLFGRYSLDVEGIAYAGGEWNSPKYKKLLPNHDNIIPITDEEYFSDDIVTSFIAFIKKVYGNEYLEDNLDFIADSLSNKGNNSREIIRNYFLKDFYQYHLKTYQKHPIYWLFDSGKENGFKALIYMHRYDEDTVGRVRADYLHKQQGFLENAISQCDIVLESNAAPADKAKAVKQREKLVKQIAETKLYDQAMAHMAHKRIPIDLDDGVKVNYAKFQGVEVASEGKKTVKVDLLAKI